MKKQNGDIVEFIKQKNYIMINNDLGGGSFGQTVLLQDPFIDELFVAKKYEPEYKSLKKEFYQNFLDEIKILYKINHKNIVRIYNYYAFENYYTGYIIMEYINGITIDDYFGNKYLEYSDKITADQVFRQLINAFCHLEKIGILHRDIREHNIMIQSDGTVKVIDFGIGKFISGSTTETDYDSLATKINRQNVNLLPNEYKEKKYTILTDMFYLGELISRLIEQSKYNFVIDFSYQDILDKMKQTNPNKRFKSFLDIQEALDKHDFENLNISDNDKLIYFHFTEQLVKSINYFVDKYEFNRQSNEIIDKLDKAIQNNLFEQYIQDNSSIISAFIKNAYSYTTGDVITCTATKNFLQWFKKFNLKSQNLILSNIQTKLSNIRIENSDDDIPF